MKDYESLLYRIKQSPYEHLGRCSVSEINPYFMGYEFARQFWGLPEIPRRLSLQKFREWQDSKVHLCRQNLESFCLLLCENEKEAFQLFFELYDSALEECKDDLIIHEKSGNEKFSQTDSKKTDMLVNFILNKSIKDRPAMYFGNHRQVTGLWAMCNGFLWAERDLDITDSSDALNMELFQQWIDERYPIAKGQTWDKVFYFNAIHSERWAMEQVYEHFEMFLEGKESNSPPKWVETAIESIKKNQKPDEKER